jgi:NitT/TauT family transport system substrate-binding protein
MLFRRLVLALVAALLALGLPACKRGGPSGPGVVRLGYFANLAHAQAVLGVASGDFARAVAPATLETTVFNAGPSLVEALFAGQIDVGYVGPGPAISAHARSRGQGIRVVAGAATNGVIVVARKGSGIAKLEDLDGKKLATPQLGNTQDVSARHFVKGAELVPIANAEQGAMLARGEIDAAWVPEPWGERLVREHEATIVAEEKDLWPSKRFALAVVVTTPDFLAAHPEQLKHVLEVHRAWTKKLAADPQAQVPALGAALFALTQKKLPDGVLATAIGRIGFDDALDPPTFSAYAAWTHDLGFDRRRTDTSDLFARVETP